MKAPLKLFILLLLLTDITYSLIIDTDTVFPAYKTVTIGSYSFDIGLDESENLIFPKSSTHITEFRVRNSDISSSIVQITGKTLSALLSTGSASNMKFYILSSIVNETNCYNNTENKTVCDTRYWKTYTEDAFTSVPLGASSARQYAVSFDTKSWANGFFNLSFTSPISVTPIELEPSVSACGTITEGLK